MAVDIITMGEMLIDFVPLKKGLSSKENEGFLRMPGGAPANVAVGIARLGLSSAFLGKVGRDPFGGLLIETLEDNGVETKAIIQTDEAKTTLAFVTLDETGDRDFTFYRDPGADMLYQWEEVDLELFKTAKIFHHGSISLINQPVRDTTLKMAQLAKNMGILVSYDPNLRRPLWPDVRTAKQWIIAGLKTADLVKLSEEELEFITDEKEINLGAKKIMAHGPKLIFVTLGAKGSYFYDGKNSKIVPGFKVKVQDTTGAGDGFVAGVLFQLIKNNVSNLNLLSESMLENMALFANAVGALTTKGKGAISSLPNLDSVNQLLKSK